MKQKILLFIPAYNCEKQIVRVLGQLDEPILEYISEIVIVNNRSTDHTEQAAMDYIEQNCQFPIKLFRNDENYGLGGSHKVAFQYAIENHFDYVIVLHGDDQGDIHDLLPYLQKGVFQKYDSFLGSRFERKSKLINYSAIRIIGNYIFNILVSIVAGVHISDLGSGLNVYKVSYLKRKFYQNFPDTLTFNVYMLLYGVYTKSNFRFFPLSWREDDQISNAKFIKQSMEIFHLLLRYLFQRKKMFHDSSQNKTHSYTYQTVYEREKQ